ncbi:hypothetical protein ACFXKJ_24590 [Kitasatospora indigofera]
MERAPFLEPPAPAEEDDAPQCAQPPAGRPLLGPGDTAYPAGATTP